MTDGKAQITRDLSIVAVTKSLMKEFSIDQEEAYKKLLATDFYECLIDLETGLYLEHNQFLCDACLLECREGKEKMHTYITRV